MSIYSLLRKGCKKLLKGKAIFFQQPAKLTCDGMHVLVLCSCRDRGEDMKFLTHPIATPECS